MSNRKKKTQHQLGYIMGERLEYRLDPTTFRALTGGGETLAFCSTYGKFHRDILEAAKHAPNLETREELRKLAETVDAEAQKLTKKGVRGTIPVCVHPTRNYWTVGRRFLTRATARHERFHADVRRIEAKAGHPVPYYGCYAPLMKTLRPIMPMKLQKFSRENWAASPNHDIEELLARVEEDRTVCLKNEKECTEIRAHHVAEIGDPKLVKAFQKFRDGVLKKYGTPQQVFRVACRKK